MSPDSVLRWKVSAVLAAVVMSGLNAVPAVANDLPAESLVVFVQDASSAAAEHFAATALPEVRSMAETMGLPVRVVEADGGAPPDVAITPLIVFQNANGRAVYQGRYTTLDRLESLIRTSRVIPQPDAELVREKLPVMQAGRAKVAAPLKIAPVTGTQPAGYDHARFEQEARRGIAKGLTRFAMADRVALTRSDRSFYMDFYPWVSEGGALYLSVALFSQFHCHDPIFEQSGEKLNGSWEDREKLFAKAAAVLEGAVIDAMRNSKIGDGFTPIADSVPVKSWEALGLPLPKRSGEFAQRASKTANVELVSSWELRESPAAARPGGSAPKSFFWRFAPPLDNYAGSVGKIAGKVSMTGGLDLRTLRGTFSADPRTVESGEPDLDIALQGSTFLHTDSFPEATFVIESVSAEPPTLSLGSLSGGAMKGTFTLKGRSIPISSQTTFEPVVDAAGRLVLQMNGSFSISPSTFSIEGPDGPDEAKDTLLMDFRFSLVPAR